MEPVSTVLPIAPVGKADGYAGGRSRCRADQSPQVGGIRRRSDGARPGRGVVAEQLRGRRQATAFGDAIRVGVGPSRLGAFPTVPSLAPVVQDFVAVRQAGGCADVAHVHASPSRAVPLQGFVRTVANRRCRNGGFVRAFPIGPVETQNLIGRAGNVRQRLTAVAGLVADDVPVLAQFGGAQRPGDYHVTRDGSTFQSVHVGDGVRSQLGIAHPVGAAIPGRPIVHGDGPGGAAQQKRVARSKPSRTRYTLRHPVPPQPTRLIFTSTALAASASL